MAETVEQAAKQNAVGRIAIEVSQGEQAAMHNRFLKGLFRMPRTGGCYSSCI